MTLPKNLGDALRLPAHAQRTAYVDLREPHSPKVLSAIALDRLVAAVARGLLRRGARSGDRIVILAENRVEFVASYFGIMRMGGVAVPVNHKLPASTIAHIFANSEVRFAFTDALRRVHVPPGVAAIEFDRADEYAFAELLTTGRPKDERCEVFEPGEGDIAEILYTSGSTGMPKGVPLTHRGQLWALSQYFARFDEVQPVDSTIVVAPLYHMNGLFFTTVALANRMTVISLPRFQPRQYLETLARYRCTVLSGVPTMFALMVRERDLIERLNFDFVREVSIGSAPLTDALLQQVQALFPRALVKNGYGTTEAGPAIFGPHPDGLPTPLLALGYPMPAVEWRLADDPSGDAGVLELRTPAQMQGYLNLPEATLQKLRDGWYSTGDVMRRDANGFFYFVGRNDDMFVCGGENIYPGEIEKLLERHAHVAQAIVVPAPDEIKGQIPVAFIVPCPGVRPNCEEIKEYALAHGPAYAHPRFVIVCEELPVSGTHKVDRTSLAAEAARVATTSA